jgi:hypothetical protein
MDMDIYTDVKINANTGSSVFFSIWIIPAVERPFDFPVLFVKSA